MKKLLFLLIFTQIIVIQNITAAQPLSIFNVYGPQEEDRIEAFFIPAQGIFVDSNGNQIGFTRPNLTTGDVEIFYLSFPGNRPVWQLAGCLYERLNNYNQIIGYRRRPMSPSVAPVVSRVPSQRPVPSNRTSTLNYLAKIEEMGGLSSYLPVYGKDGNIMLIYDRKEKWLIDKDQFYQYDKIISTAFIKDHTGTVLKFQYHNKDFEAKAIMEKEPDKNPTIIGYQVEQKRGIL